MNKKEILLPKIPYGEGTFSWLDKEHLRISFRKRINNKYEAVVGKTVQECMKKMREKEKALAILYTGSIPRGILRSKIPRTASAKRNTLRLCA